MKRRARHQDNNASYEESIGQEKIQLSVRMNKFEETTLGLSHAENDAYDVCDIVTTKAVVVVNHLVRR